MCQIIPTNPPEDISGLLAAVSQKSTRLIYEELSRFSGTLSPRAAVQLLGEALAKRLPLRVFKAILEKSPPVPETLSEGNTHVFHYIEKFGGGVGPFGLIDGAAFMGRADVLSMLLERGASPNRTGENENSPLEAAVWGRSVECVRLLVRQQELDTSWTPMLLSLWAEQEFFPSKKSSCILAMAPRFTGREVLPDRPLPIPEPMTPDIIAKAENWPLLERFCRERGSISLETAREALIEFHRNTPPRDIAKTASEYAAALAALFESCPELLDWESDWHADCRVLLHSFFYLGEDAQARLRPVAERMGRREIAMKSSDWGFFGYGEFVDSWQRLLPHGPILVIDRWEDTFDLGGFWGPELMKDPLMFAKNLRHILDVCPIRGSGKGGKGMISTLAQTVLRFGDASLIESLFRQSDGLLATEDPDALLNYVIQGRCPPANRAVVLLHVRRETDYDL